MLARIRKNITDFISSVLIYGFTRGAVRYAIQTDSKKSIFAAGLRLSIKNNWLFKYLIRRLAQARSKDWSPEKVYTESTNACNADCIMCNRKKMTRKIGVMDYALFKDIAGQCASLGVKEMRFHNFGEPMIDRLLAEKVNYAKKRGIASTVMYSNGSLLNRGIAKKLIEFGLDRLYISFDGGSKKSYEKVRVKLNFDAVSENIEQFMKIRNRLQRQNPVVELVLLPLEDDAADIQQFQKKWEGTVDSVRISALHDFAGQSNNGTKHSAAVSPVPCYMLWKSMFILWNGDVSICCMDFDGRYILGNVKKQSIEDIWTGEKFMLVRQNHLRGDLSSLALCQNCHVNHIRRLEDKLKTVKLWT